MMLARLAASPVELQPSDETSNELQGNQCLSTMSVAVLVDDSQEDLEVTVGLSSGVGIRHSRRLPRVATHVEREPVDPVGSGESNILVPGSSDIGVSLQQSTQAIMDLRDSVRRTFPTI